MGRTCRNCHDEGGDLIAPCLCSGTMKWVHRSCLDTWRTVSPNKLSFSECDVCHFKYRVQQKPVSAWDKISYALKITRDIVVVFAVAIAMIVIVGSISLLIERQTHYDEEFDPEVRQVFENVYFQLFGIGFLGLCFIIGVLAIVGAIFKSCMTCCDSCCSEPTYTYSTYSYNPCCDPWWCFMFYWWNAVYAPPGTCVCYPCCCCAVPVDDCCDACCGCVEACTSCSGDCCSGAGNCDCNCNGDAGKVLVVVVIVIIAIIILIGFFVGVAMFAVVLTKLIKNHTIVYRKQLSARELQVVDLEKHPEYMDKEDAVIQVSKSDKDSLLSNDEEDERKKKDVAAASAYVAPEITPQYNPYAYPQGPGYPPQGMVNYPPPQGMAGYPPAPPPPQGMAGYPTGPYVDPNDHSDDYPGAIVK